LHLVGSLSSLYNRILIFTEKFHAAAILLFHVLKCNSVQQFYDILRKRYCKSITKLKKRSSILVTFFLITTNKMQLFSNYNEKDATIFF